MTTRMHADGEPVESSGSRRVRRLAKEFNLPLPEDAQVVAALARLDMTESIPPELYGLVADVLAFVHRTDTLREADRG